MTVSVTYSDGIALVRLDDGKANAMGHAMFDALEAVLDEVASRARALVLAGRDGMFCAGFDLAVMKSADAGAIDALVARGGQLVLRLYEYPLPLVAAASGHGLALGGLMLLACDTRFGARGKYRYGLNETAIGLVMPGFGREIAKAVINPQQLTAALLQARLYDADGAVTAGFLDQALEESAVLDAALAEASMLAELPPATYRDCKRAVRADALQALRHSLSTDAR